MIEKIIPDSFSSSNSEIFKINCSAKTSALFTTCPMGIEYKVRFKANDAAQKDIFLRNLPNFTEFSKEWQSYRYHVEDNTGKMPNMEIRIEDEGLYLCDYNMSRHFFGLIVTKLISEFGSVMIEEYES